MRFSELCWLFAGAVLLHNLEEAIYLPSWSHTAGKWYKPLRPLGFRIAAVFISGITLALTLLAACSSPYSLTTYLIVGLAAAMALNAVVPPIALCAATGMYMPGRSQPLL